MKIEYWNWIQYFGRFSDKISRMNGWKWSCLNRVESNRGVFFSGRKQSQFLIGPQETESSD